MCVVTQSRVYAQARRRMLKCTAPFIILGVHAWAVYVWAATFERTRYSVQGPWEALSDECKAAMLISIKDDHSQKLAPAYVHIPALRCAQTNPYTRACTRSQMQEANSRVFGKSLSKTFADGHRIWRSTKVVMWCGSCSFSELCLSVNEWRSFRDVVLYQEIMIFTKKLYLHKLTKKLRNALFFLAFYSPRYFII